MHIKKNSLKDIFSYNITRRTHILKTVEKYKSTKILDILAKKFSFSSQDEIPYLIPDLSYRQEG